MARGALSLLRGGAAALAAALVGPARLGGPVGTAVGALAALAVGPRPAALARAPLALPAIALPAIARATLARAALALPALARPALALVAVAIARTAVTAQRHALVGGPPLGAAMLAAVGIAALSLAGKASALHAPPLLLLALHLALGIAQKAGVVLGMLEEGLGGDAVVAKLCVAGEDEVLLDDLLRGPPHLAIGTRALEHAVDDVAKRPRAVRLGTRTGLR